MAEEFLQEIKEPKHTDDPHDSVGKESLDGYIEIDIFKPGNKPKDRHVSQVTIKDGKRIVGDEKLPRDK
tara:strand:- start:719 stop:925 length:207 start_codon:yes stop_codon:yes gene_type:complete